MTSWHRNIFAAAAIAAVALTGCGSGTSPLTTVAAPIQSIAAVPPNGIVMGGQQPVAGVSLQIYVVGSSGYGSAATPLFTPGSVLTTASGNFTFPTINCPTPSSLTYLVGTGGQPIAGTTNPNLAMMAGLGACSTITNQFINLNELTTVASVWALSPFMTGIANIGSTSTNAIGIQNAFATINNVVNTASGHVSGPTLPTGATLPIAEIDTLADMLEQCVNSSGGSASDTTNGISNGTGCGKLFYLAAGTTTPTDTITAAMNIAQHPAQNVAKLNLLRSASPVFQPVISVNSPPSDWTIAITYSGGGLSTPQGVAVDQTGNIWVANSGNSSVSEFAPSGAAPSGASGFTAGAISTPYALAVDQSGNVWVANSGNNSITELNPSGASGSNFTGNGLSAPKSIVIDGAGDIFVANTSASSISEFTNAGAAVAGSPYTGGGISSPAAIAISPR